MRTILHVDMDAFFAAIEQRDHPEWQGLPVIVGGRVEDRGVVATASYEARVFGVHSAMPMVEAKRRCPEGIFVTSSMASYQKESKVIMSIFRQYTPEVEAISIDEAFLDVTHSRLLYGDGVAIAQAIQSDILKETQLTASIGVSYNKFLAKLASDMDKPRGLSVLCKEDLQTVVWPMSVGRMLGVGKEAEKRLLRNRIYTIGDLAQADPAMLVKILGKHAQDMYNRANGRDDRPVESDTEAKSIGRETTFAKDLTDHYQLETVLMQLTDDVCRRLRRHHVKGRTVTLKWRLADFSTFTRAVTMKQHRSDFDSVWHEVKALFKKHHSTQPLRLIGVTVSQLMPEACIFEQPLLFDDHKKHNDIDAVLDLINQKVGRQAVGRARTLVLEEDTHETDE